MDGLELAAHLRQRAWFHFEMCHWDAADLLFARAFEVEREVAAAPDTAVVL